MMLYLFSRRGPLRRNVTSVFRSGDWRRSFCKVIFIRKPNFVVIALNPRLRYNYFRFRKKTNVRHTGFYFRFRFRPHHGTRHVILHQVAKFPLNRTIRIGDIMLYRFSRWRPLRRNYVRFQICWCSSLQKVRVYHQTKFRSYNSIHSWHITISGLEKQTSAILELYFRFRFRPYHHHLCLLDKNTVGVSFYTSLVNSYKSAEKWRYVKFQDGGSPRSWILEVQWLLWKAHVGFRIGGQ